MYGITFAWLINYNVTVSDNVERANLWQGYTKAPFFIVEGHADWRNEVRNELLEVPAISVKDVTVAEDEADAN